MNKKQPKKLQKHEELELSSILEKINTLSKKQKEFLKGQLTTENLNNSLVLVLKNYQKTHDMAKLLSEIKSFCPHKSSYSYHASITLTNNRKVEDINEKNDKVIQTKKCVLSLKLNDSESKNNVSSDKLNLHLRKNSVASVGSIKVTPRSQENKNLIINRHLRSNSIASSNFSTTNAKIKKNFKEITVNPKNMETEKSEFKEKKEQKQTLASANITPLSKDVVVDYRELDLKLQIDNIVKHGKNIHRSYQKF